jgi:hypothetical protein
MPTKHLPQGDEGDPQNWLLASTSHTELQQTRSVRFLPKYPPLLIPQERPGLHCELSVQLFWPTKQGHCAVHCVELGSHAGEAQVVSGEKRNGAIVTGVGFVVVVVGAN